MRTPLAVLLALSLVLAVGVSASPAQAGPPLAPVAPLSDPPPVTGAVATALGLALERSSLSPDALAGAYVEPGSRQVVIAAVDLAAGRTAVAALTRAMSGAVPLATVPVRHSERELATITGSVYTDVAKGPRLYSAAVDHRRNRVVVRAEAVTDDLRADLYARYGDAVAVTVGAPAHVRSVVGDTSPFYGGTEVGYKDVDLGFLITPRWACTSGFAWRPPNGIQALLTAGHCVPRYGPAPYAYTDRENWDEKVGNAGSSTFVLGTGTIPYGGGYKGDLGFVNIAPGKLGSPVIQTSASTTATVRGSVRPTAGTTYCHAGVTSGRLCGWTVTTTSASYTDSDTHEVVRGVMEAKKQGGCTLAGDSGGPAYQASGTGVLAVGIISGGGGGGSDDWGGLLDPCYAWDTSIQMATAAFGGALRVA